MHLERATTQCSGRTEYRGLETSGRRLLGTSVISGESKVRGCDVHCTNGRAVFSLVKSARCVLMAHNCVSMCTNTGQQLEVCALCTCAVCVLCSIGAKNSHCKCRILHCTVCIALYVYKGRGLVCTDLLASLSYLGLYHILLLSADKPSLKDQKTVLPQRSRTKELLFTISDRSYMGQNTRQGNSRS